VGGLFSGVSYFTYNISSLTMSAKIEKHTKNILSARLLLASVFFFPRVISFSASRCASLALGYVVDIDSCVKRDVTRLRRRACLCEDVRPRCRYLNLAPAMLKSQEINGDFSRFGGPSANVDLGLEIGEYSEPGLRVSIDTSWELWDLLVRLIEI
jgi:hypothetical protein